MYSNISLGKIRIYITTLKINIKSSKILTQCLVSFAIFLCSQWEIKSVNPNLQRTSSDHVLCLLDLNSFCENTVFSFLTWLDMSAIIFQMSENLICEGNCNYHISCSQCFFQRKKKPWWRVKDCSLFTLIVSKQQRPQQRALWKIINSLQENNVQRGLKNWRLESENGNNCP